MGGNRSKRTALLGALLAGVLAVGVASALAVPPAPPLPTAPAMVGTNAGVQTWFKKHEAQKIALDNALQAAYRQLSTGTPTNGCARLMTAANGWLATLPTPRHALDQQVVVGIAQFKAGAAQCIAGHSVAARKTLVAGAALRATAQEAIDEILEAPNGTVK
jgi:hypothetical protein